MSDSASKLAGLYQRLPRPDRWAFPVQPSLLKNTDGSIVLAPGLYLLFGPKASGKTVTSLAFAIWAKETGLVTTFCYMMEPRARLGADLMKETNWDDAYRELLKRNQGGVLVLDSLTYLIAKLSAVREVEQDLSRVTYAGGLAPRDVLGVLTHDHMARAANVAVVATVNSELFPVIDKLEGAAEGQMILRSPGVYSFRSRVSRALINVTVPVLHFRQARVALGYDNAQVFQAGSIKEIV